jgi:hypothetical protein
MCGATNPPTIAREDARMKKFAEIRESQRQEDEQYEVRRKLLSESPVAAEPQAPRWCEMPGCGKGEYAHYGPCRPLQMMQANERYRGMVHGEVHARLTDCGLMTPCIPVPVEQQAPQMMQASRTSGAFYPHGAAGHRWSSWCPTFNCEPMPVEQPKDIAVKCVLCGQPEHWGKRCEPPNPHPMTLEQARQPDGMIVPCQTCIAIPCVCGAEGVHVASQPAPPPKDVAVTEGDDEEGESVIQPGVREINERHAALYERATRAEAAIAAVRELHAPDLVGDATRMALGLPTNRVCSVCENREGNVIPYPCETIRAIDAVAAPERTEMA